MRLPWLVSISSVILFSLPPVSSASDSTMKTPPTIRFVVGPSFPIWMLGTGIGVSAQLGFRTGIPLYLGLETGAYYWLGSNTSNLKLNAWSFPVLGSLVYRFDEGEKVSPYLGLLTGITRVSGEVRIAGWGGDSRGTFFTVAAEPGVEFVIGERTSFFVEAKAGALIGEGGFWPVLVPTAGISILF